MYWCLTNLYIFFVKTISIKEVIRLLFDNLPTHNVTYRNTYQLFLSKAYYITINTLCNWIIKCKTEHQTIGIIPKSIIKIVGRGKIDIPNKIIRCFAMKVYFSTMELIRVRTVLLCFLSYLILIFIALFSGTCSWFLNSQYTTVIYKCIKFEFPNELTLKRAIVYLFIVIHILKVKFRQQHFTSCITSPFAYKQY